MSKDSTRSIRLDGDVSEIAQKLADDKMLSHTLSKLLRQHYGLNTEIDAIKTRGKIRTTQALKPTRTGAHRKINSKQIF